MNNVKISDIVSHVTRSASWRVFLVAATVDLIALVALALFIDSRIVASQNAQAHNIRLIKQEINIMWNEMERSRQQCGMALLPPPASYSQES